MNETKEINLKSLKSKLLERVKFVEIHIVLDRLRSAYNVGNIFRLADAVGAKEVITCGYTAHPPHRKLAKTALGAEKTVPNRHFDDCLEAIRVLREEGVIAIFAVECDPRGVAPWELKTIPSSLALVFGNEALGLSPAILEACDMIIKLPLFGKKSSINVANCAAAVLYGFLAMRYVKSNW